jgi:hypothetical protein
MSDKEINQPSTELVQPSPFQSKALGFEELYAKYPGKPIHGSFVQLDEQSKGRSVIATVSD